MIATRIKEKVFQTIGIPSNIPGQQYQTTSADSEKKITELLSFWMVVIKGRGVHPSIEELVLSIFKTKHWHRAVCMLTSDNTANEFPNASTKQYITLTNWIDPVAIALKSYNLFPEDINVVTKPKYVYQFTFGTKNTFGYVTCDVLFPPDLNLPLWYALEECMVYFAEQYDNELLKTYIGYDELKVKVEQRKDKE